MKKFRRSILGKSPGNDNNHPQVVSVHLESTSTVLDDLRGQATWEEEWNDKHPGMAAATNHERKVHLISDLLGQADGVRAFREVLESSPALRALMRDSSDGGADGGGGPDDDDHLQAIQAKLGEGEKFKGEHARSGRGGDAVVQAVPRDTSSQEFYHLRDRLRSLVEREGNAVCADCTAKVPTWASVNVGVFLCTQCAGCHRAMGVHISKVLSVQLDDWTEDQVQFMSGMGNSLANSFLEYHVPSTWMKPSNLEPRDYREAYIKAKYQDRAFEFRAHKKPVTKPPPSVDETLMVGGGHDRSGGALSQGMTEYIGFVNIVLVRGKDLVPAGFVSQQQYMAVLRIGTQEVRSRWARADGAPSWSEKLMLCWDGSMPLNIDMYGGKEHIGQAQVPLRSLLLEEERQNSTDNSKYDSPTTTTTTTATTPAPPTAPSSDDARLDDSVYRTLEGILASPSAHAPDAGSTLPDSMSFQQHERHAGPSAHPAPSFLSSLSSGPPTLGSLSASTSAGTTPVPGLQQTPPSGRTPPSGSRKPRAMEDDSPAASESKTPFVCSNGGGFEVCNEGGFSLPMPRGVDLGSTAGGGGGGGGAAAGATRGRAGASAPSNGMDGLFGLGESSATARNLSGRGSMIEVLQDGDLYVTLQDKEETKQGDRSAAVTPSTSSRTGSPHASLSNRTVSSNGSSGNVSGGMTLGKSSLNSMMLGLNKIGKGAGGGGGGSNSLGHAHTRPAQGGVVIKMDFVRIEH